MKIIQEGYYFAGVALFIALFVGILLSPYAAIPFMVLACYCIYFFRNPERKIPVDETLIVSPADGTVQDVVHLNDDEFVNSPCTKVIIFLSIFDVHVNRSPISGEIKLQKYICGRFRPAYKESVGFENERHLIGIENEKLRVTVTQIAGILARRIVSWVTLDDRLEKGELYGLIRFGSCTEIVVPETVEVLVSKGEKVRGGETIIGKLNPSLVAGADDDSQEDLQEENLY